MDQDCDVLIGSNETYPLRMINEKAPLLGTHQYGVCWDGGNVYRSGEFYPFRANIVGTVTSDVNSDGEVIVTIKDLRIIPSGTSDRYGSTRAYAAPWYGSISNATPAYRAIALTVTTSQRVPSDNDSSWHKCLGGWYAAGVSCGSACVTDRYGNKPGGTRGLWADWYGGSAPAFSTSDGQTFSRNVPDQSWNLGHVAPTDGNTAKIWVIAHWQQGIGYGLNCNIGMAGKSYVAGLSFDIPVLKLCPPEFDHEEQKENVCENCDDVTLYFKASEQGGQPTVNLIVDYKYEGQDWSIAESVSTTATQNEETSITLPCVTPERKLIWRARYELTSGYTAHSDWVDGSTTTIFVPSIGMVVPDITEDECVKMGQGREIEHFTHERGYYG